MTAGRRLNLPKTIDDFDFAFLAKKEKHARTRIRLLGLEHLKKGKTAINWLPFIRLQVVCLLENKALH